MSRPHPAIWSRRLLGLLLLGAVLGTGACTLVNDPGRAEPGARPVEASPEPEAEPVTRAYRGQFSVQGATIPVRLRWTSVGSEVREARLTVPELDMEAVGHGSLQDGRLYLELAYGGDCGGDVTVDGRLENDGYSVEGTMIAEDCTGREEGGLVLLLRPDDGPDAPRR